MKTEREKRLEAALRDLTRLISSYRTLFNADEVNMMAYLRNAEGALADEAAGGGDDTTPPQQRDALEAFNRIRHRVVGISNAKEDEQDTAIVLHALTNPAVPTVPGIVRERLRCMAKQRSSEDMTEDEDELQDADFQGGYDQMVFEARKAHNELERAIAQSGEGRDHGQCPKCERPLETRTLILCPDCDVRITPSKAAPEPDEADAQEGE